VTEQLLEQQLESPSGTGRVEPRSQIRLSGPAPNERDTTKPTPHSHWQIWRDKVSGGEQQSLPMADSTVIGPGGVILSAMTAAWGTRTYWFESWPSSCRDRYSHGDVDWRGPGRRDRDSQRAYEGIVR
jgi:hypothetical protein